MTQGGFQFDLCGRNAYLEARGIKPPRFTKTGTTIAGLIFKVCLVVKYRSGELIISPFRQAPRHIWRPALLEQITTVMQDGVVLGADTRSTSDTTVADKNCEKIHYIAPNIYCCGAGTAADTESVTGACLLTLSTIFHQTTIR